MNFIWEFYEYLDEMVYSADMETYELVYMNSCLRKSLGFNCHNEYKGEKCYRVLQGLDKPCSFCTNKLLKPKRFISWTHKNPILNKRFLIKDSMINFDDRQYRIEIAIDIDSEITCNTPYYYARSETILNECLQQIFSTNNPEESIEKLLEYIGKTFLCDRVYIFEIHDTNKTSNTYEWCAQGVTAQKEILQNESLEAINWWVKEFEENNIIFIKDLEDIRTKYPSAYAVLKPQNISTLVVGPITSQGKLLGFIGVDNPQENMMSMIKPLINVIGYFTSSLLKRRDLLKVLNKLGYQDLLTGAFNRNAFTKFCKQFKDRTMGVIFCDITGLKQINDSMGHEAGDRLICDSFNLIKKTLNTDLIYRIGGDEFIVLYPGYDRKNFDKNVDKLQNVIYESETHIAVGSSWSDEVPINIEKLVSDADKQMYEDKRDYYKKRHTICSVPKPFKEVQERMLLNNMNSQFNKFLLSTYYDAESVFKSISQENTSSYFYFGDMQKNLFYISDNLKSDFGFSNNVVLDFHKQWAKRISNLEFRNMFWNDISNMIDEKKTIHDLRYQVKNISGKNIWIRCYGILKWNEDKSKPLFLSGRISHQDEDFVVDSVTNFPREHTLFFAIERA